MSKPINIPHNFSIVNKAWFYNDKEKSFHISFREYEVKEKINNITLVTKIPAMQFDFFGKINKRREKVRRMKKCKVIKKIIYKGLDPSERVYKQLPNGQVVADIYRSVYQDSKRDCRNMTKKQVREYLKRKEVNQ